MAPGLSLPRHRHRAGYATVVLAGSFVEASFAGRFEVEPGDVLLHGRFDCHQNLGKSQRGPQILRLPWDDDTCEGRFRIRDPDRLARVAELDPIAAMRELKAQLSRIDSPSEAHWCERLAADLVAQPGLNLDAWSENAQLAPETVSRGFRRVFGASPRTFRCEARTRRAWREVVSCGRPLTTIAHQEGFADLAHMSRSIHAFTGNTPTFWRNLALLRSSAFKPPEIPADSLPLRNVTMRIAS